MTFDVREITYCGRPVMVEYARHVEPRTWEYPGSDEITFFSVEYNGRQIINLVDLNEVEQALREQS